MGRLVINNAMTVNGAFEAPSPEEILAAAKRNNIPADAIVEVSRLTPSLVT